MTQRLRVVTPAAWLAADLAAGTPSRRVWTDADLDDRQSPCGLAVVHDLGLWAPPPAAEAVWWMPGAHAARLNASGVHPPLSSPGPRALLAFSAKHLRRRVSVMTLLEATSADERPGPVFAKVADTKVAGLPAQVHPHLADFTTAARAAGLEPGTAVIVSDVVDYAAEYRVFVLDGAAVAASAYLMDGATWDAWAPPDLPDTSRARAFATEALAAATSPLPAAFVLDVGVDRDGRWSVIETNPAWSSNPYWATEHDAAAVVATIAASQHPGQAHAFGWRSDLPGGRARPLPPR